MTLAAALKTGKAVRIKKAISCGIYSGYCGATSWIMPNTWIDPEYLLSVATLTKDLIVSNKWETRKAKKKSK